MSELRKRAEFSVTSAITPDDHVVDRIRGRRCCVSMLPPNRRTLMRARAFPLIGGFASLVLFGCSGGTTAPSPTILLDATVTLIPVQNNCYATSVTRDFTGTVNKSISIVATSPGLTVGLILYAPDYTTQLRGSTGTTTASSPAAAQLSASGANSATLNLPLMEPGTYHLDLCELNGLGGNVHVVVTQN